MTKHHQGWNSAEIAALEQLMKNSTKSPSKLHKQHARANGRTPAAVYAKWHSINKKVGGTTPIVAHVPLTGRIPKLGFNNFIKKLEGITGHTFTPTEIVDIANLAQETS